MSQIQPVNILLVDDDEIDVETVKMELKDHRIANPVYVARDGIEALEMIRGLNGQEPIPHPYLILLDINMPRMNGHEFLEEIRKDPEHHSAIVFILTTSNDDADRFKAYEHNVAGYIVKDHAGENFQSAIKLLEHYWKVVEFPPASSTQF